MTDIREHETGNKLDVDLLGSMQRSFYVGEDVPQAVETKKTIAIEG